MDTYIINSDKDSIEVKLSLFLDYFFTAAFTLEMIIKTVSIGLVLEKGTYLRDSWN